MTQDAKIHIEVQAMDAQSVADFVTSDAFVSAMQQTPLSDTTIDAWYSETFHNLGLDTSLQNRFYAAKEELKKRIRNALAQ